MLCNINICKILARFSVECWYYDFWQFLFLSFILKINKPITICAWLTFKPTKVKDKNNPKIKI